MDRINVVVGRGDQELVDAEFAQRVQSLDTTMRGTHNGKLVDIDRRFGSELSRFRPLGETDSEVAACLLFERMARVWNAATTPPTLEALSLIHI